MEFAQQQKIKYSSVFIIVTLALSSALMFMAQPTRAMYMPRRRGYHSEYQPEMGLDGGEEDDMDQTASAPNRNRESNTEGPSSDGYEENEPDGPYGETRRDEEGQADLERFFDDHLGASEREGMDKENLPTNIAPLISNEISSRSPVMKTTGSVARDRSGIGSMPVGGMHRNDDNYQYLGSATIKSYQKLNTNTGTVAKPDKIEEPTSDYLKTEPVGDVETEYIRSPNKSAIIARQVTPLQPVSSKERRSTKAPVIGGKHLPATSLLVGSVVVNEILPSSSLARQQLVSSNSGDSPSSSQANDVLTTENDDYDQVYVTNKTNQPFKIDALGGYDPEEDFQDASRDIEEPTKFNSSPFEEHRGDAKRIGGKKGKQEPPKDINFNDPDSDNLFDAASETDEVTFNQDDPDQSDEGGEQQAHLANDQHQAHSEVRSREAPTSLRRVQDGGEPNYSPGASASNPSEAKLDGSDDDDGTGDTGATQDRAGRSGGSDNDGSDSNWVNDGVDDMEVPSQQHQDMVLEKAARAEAEAQKRRDEAEATAAARAEAQGNKSDDNENEEEGQRMPNADYMKEDTDDIDKRR